MQANVILQILKAVLLKTAPLDVKPYRLVSSYRRFDKYYCLNFRAKQFKKSSLYLSKRL
jgi:hypothetical protein